MCWPKVGSSSSLTGTNDKDPFANCPWGGVSWPRLLTYSGASQGEAKDIGEAVAYLASDGARYVTGQSIVVDGGQVLPEGPEALAEM